MYLIYLKFRSKDGYHTSRKKGAWIFLPTTSSSHFEEEERSVTFRCATFESRMRGVFTEGHVEASPPLSPPRRWAEAEGSHSRLHRVSFLPATRPAGFRLPFLPLSHRDGYGFDGWKVLVASIPRHTDPLFIYIYIYVVHSRIPLSPQ